MYIPVPITLPSGVVRSSSKYGVRGRYFNADKVRFYEGKPQRWGGWQKLTDDVLDGPSRGSISWRSNAGDRYAAFGTPDKLWVFNDGTLYDITPVGLPAGDPDSVGGPTSWGEVAWGESAWGGFEDIIRGNISNASCWSLAIWGENLLAVRRGSTLYEWNLLNGPLIPAQPVAGAPITALGVFVTEDRHAVVYGAHDGVSDDALRLQWPSQETLTDWVPTETNTAGDIRVEQCNEIRASVPIGDGHIILGDTSIYTWRYIGGDFVFAKKRLAATQGIIGPLAGTEYDGDAYWMSQDSFQKYDGSAVQVPCDVKAYVFNNLNRYQTYKIHCGTNKEFGEIIWFYPDSASFECNRYVTYQPATGDWSIGTISRTSWIDEGAFTSKPIAVSAAGVIYRHEVGTLADGQPMQYLLESGDFDIEPQAVMSATGNHMMVRKIVPDYERLDLGNHRMTVVRRDYPQAPEKTKGPYAFNAATKAYFPRARGMTMALRFEGDADFRMGNLKGYITQAGGR